MALAADHSTLPRASSDAVGWAPDPDPRFIGALADQWANDADEDKPTALGTRLRHSDAGKCARYLGYTAAGIAKTDPMDLTGIWNTSLGTLLHELWQNAVTERWPDAVIEATYGWDDLDASCHIDAIIHDGERIIAYELKTVGGYAFKAAIGKIRRGTPAEGPKAEHVAQASLNGLAADADEVVVGYLAKETLSVNVGAGLSELGRFAAEWTLPRDEFEPIANAEKDRMLAILGLVDSGYLPARKFPPGTLPRGAEIVDPSTGRWEVGDGEKVAETGTWWACGYCSHRTLCAKTQPGRTPIDEVVEIRKGIAS